MTPNVVLSTHVWIMMSTPQNMFVGGASFWIDNGLSPHATV